MGVASHPPRRFVRPIVFDPQRKHDHLMFMTADMLRHYHLAISSGVGSVSSLLGWIMMCLSPLRMSTGPPMTLVNTVRGTVCQPWPIISATLVAWSRETINRSPCAGLHSALRSKQLQALPFGGGPHAPNGSLSRPMSAPGVTGRASAKKRGSGLDADAGGRQARNPPTSASP